MSWLFAVLGGIELMKAWSHRQAKEWDWYRCSVTNAAIWLATANILAAIK